MLGGRAGLPIAIVAGALMPGCSRTTMPIVMGLRGMRGPRLGSLAALVFVAPLLRPITVVLTWSVLGWRMTVARVVAALAGSALLGALVNRFEPWFGRRQLPRIAGASQALDACCDSESCGMTTTAGGDRAWSRLVENLWQIVRRVIPYFVVGMALAEAVSTLLPEDAIPRALGGAGGVWEYLFAAVAGAPLYVCQGEEVPLTYAVLATGVGPGSSSHVPAGRCRHVRADRGDVTGRSRPPRHLRLHRALDHVRDRLGRRLSDADRPLTRSATPVPRIRAERVRARRR
jgi:uncharacterized membrane protein YraQ (UPF0718 family)